MARPLVFLERVLARFSAGTLARIAAVLGDGEDRASFIRAAVERELLRREASRKPSTNSNPRLQKAARRQGGK